MTRKTISERRIAGANKQIAQLTEALDAERKQRVLDDEKATQIIATNRRVIDDQAGLIKHLKGNTHHLRIKLGEAEQAAKESRATITKQSRQLHEIDTASAATAENLAHFKALSEEYSRQADTFQNMAQRELNRAEANKESRIQAEKDVKAWKYSFLVAVAITVIAQVVNYVAG